MAEPQTAEHTTAITDKGGRYPYQPTCSCGWSTWGYLTEYAAQMMAQDHREGRD